MNDRALGHEGETLRSSSWMPRASLRVGVTGHRLERLGAGNAVALAPAIHDVLAAVARAARGSFPDAPSFRLVTALADGADSIVADRAIAHGWALDVVLP
nr:hypothetical protein [Sphingomonadaceae bacterium]